MGVVHHGLVWRPTRRDCAALRDVRRIAGSGDADALSLLSQRFRRSASPCGEIMSAFGIGDAAYLDRWTSPPAFDPALAAVLAWIPGMTLLDPPEAEALAALRWTGAGVPPRSRKAFRSLYSILDRIAGPVDADPRRTMGHLGYWARASTLARFVPGGLRLGLPTEIAEPRRTWLVVNTLW